MGNIKNKIVCPDCKRINYDNPLRAYVRINNPNGRSWQPIGYYCFICKTFFNDIPLNQENGDDKKND